MEAFISSFEEVCVGGGWLQWTINNDGKRSSSSSIFFKATRLPAEEPYTKTVEKKELGRVIASNQQSMLKVHTSISNCIKITFENIRKTIKI